MRARALSLIVAGPESPTTIAAELGLDVRSVAYHAGLLEAEDQVVSSTLNAGIMRTAVDAFAGQVTYLRLVQPDSVNWQSRAHFLGFAAWTMKRILVDHARKRQAKIRNEGVKPLPLDELRDLPVEFDQELIALDDALQVLKELNERQSRAVELFHFAGLTYVEIGEVLGCSEATAKRALQAGRAWLRREIRSLETPSEEPATR